MRGLIHLQSFSSLEGVAECDLVGVLQVDANWQATREAAHFDIDTGVLDMALEKQRG